MSHKTTIHWILHTWFFDLLHWTIVIHVIHAMPKIVFFVKKVHLRGFVNEPTIFSIDNWANQDT